MPVTTIRIDEEDITYLDEIAKNHSLDRTNLIKRAIKRGVKDILLDDALMEYQKGKASAWECARQAKITLWEFLEILKARGIYFRTDEIELERALNTLSSK